MATVLIVEDTLTIRTAVIRARTERGHSVTSAPTAMIGLQLAVTDRPDGVLLDLGLPDPDGREGLRMPRAATQVTIIVATARSTEAEIVRLLDAGPYASVLKSFVASPFGPPITPVL